MRIILGIICFCLIIDHTITAQTYSAMQYEVVQHSSNSLTIVQDDKTEHGCSVTPYSKYGFQSYDEAYIPELTGQDDKDYGNNIKFFYSTAGIYAINVWYKTDHSDFWSCWYKEHRTTKFIYIYVKPANALQTITLPVDGSSYTIPGVADNTNQRRQGDCINEIQMGWKSSYYQYTNELTNSSPKYSVGSLTFNPTRVGSFTYIPVSRYADKPGLPCTSNTQFSDFKEWSPITVVVENFTWKDTTPTILCKDQAAINLSTYFNISSGVTFEGPGVSGTTFNPTTAGVGTHQIRAKKTYSSGLEYNDFYIDVVTTTSLSTSLPVKTCNDLDLTQFFTSNKAGGTWSFSALTTDNLPTGGISGNNLVLAQTTVPQIRVVGTYTIGGCVSHSVSKVLDVVPGGNGGLSITNNANYCQSVGTVPLTYSITGATASSATWSGTGVTSTNLDLSSVVAGQEANVMLQVTTSAGCVLNSSKKILVKPTPSLNFSVLAENLCNSGQTVNLNNTYQPKDGNASITGTWSSSNSTINSKIASNSISISGLAQGIYPLTFAHTNSSGCSASQTLANSFKVYEQPKATLQLNVAPQEQVCSSTNFTLSTETVSSNLGINWFSPSGFIGSSASIATGTLSTGEYTYNLYVNNNSNPACISSANVILNVSNPTPLTLASTVNLCQGEYSVDLNSKTSPNYDSGVYSSTSSIIQSRLFNTWNASLNLSGVPTGNYVITYSVMWNTCVLTKNFTLVVTSEYADPVVSGSTILCQPQSVGYSITSPVPSLTYRWYNTVDAASPFHTGTSYQTPMLATSTVYYLQAYNSSTKCASNRAPLNIAVQRMDTVNMAVGENLASCTNAVSFSLNRPEVRPAGGSWSGPGVTGSTFNGNALANNKAYSIIYSYTKDLCTKRDTLLITLGIDLKPTVSKKTVYTGELLTFDHNYPNATSTYWTFGDGIKSVDRQTSHYYYREGYKNVSLTITVNQNGTCTGSITMPNFVNVVDTFDVVTGTEDPILSESKLSVYPNPFKNHLNLNSATHLGKVRVAILASDGRVVFDHETEVKEGGQELVPYSVVATLPEGIYIIRIVGAGQSNSVAMRVLKL